jgi:xylan 1,4-beta-xylosidase
MGKMTSKGWLVAAGAAAMGFTIAQSGVPYTINVDAGKGTSALNRFWERCMGSDHFYTVINSGYGGNIRGAYKIAKEELGVKAIRAHGMLNDDVGIYKEVNGTPTYDWKNYDTIVDYMVSLGWKPIIELSFMPKDLASGTTTTCWYNGVPGNVTPPKDYNKWKNLATEIIKHSESRYGAEEVRQWRWEVWNEPDIKPQFFTGSEDDYFRMYDYAAEGIAAADSLVKVGGPATALSDTAGMLKRFLQHCLTTNYANPAKKSTKVDFISWHQYPWNEGDQNPTGFAGRNRGIDIFLKRYPQLKLENLQTEWNASARYNYFDDEANASFVAKAVHSLFPEMNQGAAPPDVFSFWVVSDIFEENNLSSTSAFAGAMGLMLRQRDVRKPSFNAFKMLHMLGDSTLSLTGGTAASATKGLNGIATISEDKSKVQVLIYDHTYGSGNNPTFTNAVDTVHLSIRNLPFTSPTVQVQRWGVDKEHSNSFTTWVNQGRPAKPSTAQWDQLEKDGTLKELEPAASATLSNGTFTKVYTQGQPGVSLLVLTGTPPVGLKAAAPRPEAGLSLHAARIANSVAVAYTLPRPMAVTLTLVDARGRTAATLARGSSQEAGAHLARAEGVRPGSYVCVLRAGDTVIESAAVTVPR